MLTFIIPTKKRARELAVAIKSIAEQVEDDTKIIVLFNKAEEDTKRTISRAAEKWPFVTSVGVDGEPGYDEKFRSMFRLAKDEWIWTFGDDDRLQPGALKFMLGRLKEAPKDLSFIHVAERKRSGGTSHTFTGRLIDLCCQMGWLDMTGFISGYITRGEALARCAEVEHWGLYAKSAFVQSCALLDVLLVEQAQFIDIPLIDTQEETQTVECSARWSAENIAARYFNVAEAIESMMARGLIKKKLPIKFFRYMNYHLWDRHLTYYISCWMHNGEIWHDEWAKHMESLASLIDDEDVAKRIREDVENSMCLVKAHAVLKVKEKTTETALKEIYERRSSSPYPYTFTQPMELAA